jgi:hypothetical protein
MTGGRVDERMVEATTCRPARPCPDARSRATAPTGRGPHYPHETQARSRGAKLHQRLEPSEGIEVVELLRRGACMHDDSDDAPSVCSRHPGDDYLIALAASVGPSASHSTISSAQGPLRTHKQALRPAPESVLGRSRARSTTSGRNGGHPPTSCYASSRSSSTRST